ncbi:hypothetical protein niasHT_023989 [Heterodera trifolii]|uniref:Acyl-CoA dehydrogenase n=1 Tax=Heterodera trifolii TaxID=157864 RepID=A0ABD2KP97_9BILA
MICSRLFSSPISSSVCRRSLRRIGYCADPTIGLSSEQIEIQRMAKDFAKKELYPEMDKWDKLGQLPMDALRKAGELGFGAIYCADAYGGAGLSRSDAALVFEQLAAGCCSTAAYMAVHNMVPWMIDRFANEELKQRYIPELASFTKLASYCLTEPGSGSDSAALRTNARREGDHYIVNGSKAFISGSGVSSVYLVMMRHKDAPPGPKGIFALIMTPDMPGFQLGKDESKLGWCTQPTRILTFEDVKVPVSNQVGADDEGFTIAMEGLDGVVIALSHFVLGRVNIAACSLGAAQMSMDLAIEHTKVRQAFGKSIAQFQWTQFKLAEMATKLVTSRLLLREACHHLQEGTPNASAMSAMAKMYITDEAFTVINQALQMFGGYGILKDYALQQYLRDCRVHQIIEGTNEIMRLVVARNLLTNEIFNTQ